MPLTRRLPPPPAAAGCSCLPCAPRPARTWSTAAAPSARSCPAGPPPVPLPPSSACHSAQQRGFLQRPRAPVAYKYADALAEQHARCPAQRAPAVLGCDGPAQRGHVVAAAALRVGRDHRRCRRVRPILLPNSLRDHGAGRVGKAAGPRLSDRIALRLCMPSPLAPNASHPMCMPPSSHCSACGRCHYTLSPSGDACRMLMESCHGLAMHLQGWLREPAVAPALTRAAWPPLPSATGARAAPALGQGPPVMPGLVPGGAANVLCCGRWPPRGLPSASMVPLAAPTVPRRHEKWPTMLAPAQLQRMQAHPAPQGTMIVPLHMTQADAAGPVRCCTQRARLA